MASQQITLLPVDVVDVTILVDNFLDILLPSDEVAHRAPLHYDWSDREQLIAEHGYSLLLTVVREGRSESVLYDAGLGRKTVLHNMDVLEVRATDLRAVILSHGHADHHGGLEGNTSHLRTSYRKRRCKRIKQIDKIEELILRIERFRRRHLALLRFVLVIDFLDLPAVDT